jgi:formimidoylglutamate deiminase
MRMHFNPSTAYWAPAAWLPGGWQRNVLLHTDDQGHWRDITPDTPCPPQAMVLAGPVLPGLVNGHSHAFQRAFAGLAESVAPGQAAGDNFWSWRDRMYRVAAAITPETLQVIATQVYGELLRGGYTQVCEFHYLAHQADGSPYPEPEALSQALINAAADVGLGLTLLPVLYERAGFTQDTLRPDQHRFHRDAQAVLTAQRFAAAQGSALLNAGVAVHSLRAARPASVHLLKELTAQLDGPVHIHVAEQIGEVQDCLQVTGQRPVAWLAQEGLLDARWQLVHATHVEPAEIESVARSGAGVVLCPATEANLGDGLTDLPGWLRAGVPLSLGSDSQVLRDWREELRWLEYGQRLALRQRNVAPAALGTAGSTAQLLWQRVLAGGAAAAGLRQWGLVAGARADLLVVDPDDDNLAGLPLTKLLDSLVLCGPTRPWQAVMVAGRWVHRQHHLPGAQVAHQRFAALMHSLWPED